MTIKVAKKTTLHILGHAGAMCGGGQCRALGG